MRLEMITNSVLVQNFPIYSVFYYFNGQKYCTLFDGHISPNYSACQQVENLNVLQNFYAGKGVMSVNKTQLVDIAGDENRVFINGEYTSLIKTIQQKYNSNCRNV